ncbi:ribosome biogenesis/translation initiation ATPase RLI [Candidatus Undinarchaeota archaeon]
MRIAVIDKEDCHPEKCGWVCMNFCPGNRSGDETIVQSSDGKVEINEELCIGCGICVNKCPFGCITIVNLPDELENPFHQYGKNGFRLFGLPAPQEGKVVGIIGQNGVGKTTAVSILSGELKPNLGGERGLEYSEVAEKMDSPALQNYFRELADGKIKAVYKPQYVDQIPKIVKGTVRELLEKSDQKGKMDEMVSDFGLEACLDRKIDQVSGGELQRIAVAVAMLKKGNLYIFDEPSSYLDVRERLNVARAIRELAKEAKVLVVEHDLIVLDYLADSIHVLYGKPRTYGIVSGVYGGRVGINTYLGGYLPEENMRIRDKAIQFEKKEAHTVVERTTFLKFSEIGKKFDDFDLKVGAGEIKNEEVIGILGPNATGKTTFVKILAGVLKQDEGDVEKSVTVSYKPQYLKPSNDLVIDVLGKTDYSKYRSYFDRFGVEELMDKKLSEMSGGELQRIAIAECLSKDAEVYLLDEPSAHLDVEQRIMASKIIRDFTIKNEKTSIVVDHDVLFIDYLSDRLTVFGGEPGKHGIASSPQGMRKGMNEFLTDLDITMRRDPETGRPRVNKADSQKDKEQKSSGEYYYTK